MYLNLNILQTFSHISARNTVEMSHNILHIHWRVVEPIFSLVGIARRCQIFRLGSVFRFRFLNQLLPWFLHWFLFRSQEPYSVPFSVLFKSQEPSSGLFHGLFLKVKYLSNDSIFRVYFLVLSSFSPVLVHIS